MNFRHDDDGGDVTLCSMKDLNHSMRVFGSVKDQDHNANLNRIKYMSMTVLNLLKNRSMKDQDHSANLSRIQCMSRPMLSFHLSVCLMQAQLN